MSGKIIGNARRDLESLYRIAVLDCTWHSRHRAPIPQRHSTPRNRYAG
jgi:hypothetical protein